MANVSRIVALGGSIYRILRVSEALGTPVTNGLESLGGSPLTHVRASSEVWIFGGLESLEARSDECLEDRVPGKLHLSYSTSLGGSWELPPRDYTRGFRLKNIDRRRFGAYGSGRMLSTHSTFDHVKVFRGLLAAH